MTQQLLLLHLRCVDVTIARYVLNISYCLDLNGVISACTVD